MSEHEPRAHSPEHHRGHSEGHAEQQEKLKQLIERAGESKEHSKQEVAHLAAEAKEKAVSGHDTKTHELGKDKQHHSPLIIDRVIKAQAYQKVLTHVQRHLPKGQRAFSKFVHQPSVEAISELGAKTIARPSGLFGGGLCALIGGVIIFLMSRHYGFEYNFFVFIALVAGGFVAGVLIESLWRVGRKAFKP